MNSSALRFRDVTRSFGSTRALDGLDMEVPRGSICGFVGPNGAGKTTTMAIATGLLMPDSGIVDILGQGPFDATLHSGRVSLLPQDCRLNPHTSIRNLLIHLARLQGMSRSQARKDCARLLEAVALEERANRSLRTLSHGMKRRLYVAQAFLGNPELVLLDEPMAGLDPQIVVRIRDLMFMHRGSCTLLVSSHVLWELETFCDHMIFLDSGRCVENAPMDVLTDKKCTVRVSFTGQLPLQALQAALPDLELALEAGELQIKAPASWSLSRLNGICLPVLLVNGVEILEVKAGRSLEEAYLDSGKTQETYE